MNSGIVVGIYALSFKILLNEHFLQMIAVAITIYT